MDREKALQIIWDFKGQDIHGDTHQIFSNLQRNLIGKRQNKIPEVIDLFEAALEVKLLSSRIDEIVHAAGIIKALPLILKKREKVESASLASGAEGEGFDLVTNLRIAEFKFSKWQIGSSNGMRKRQVFSDYINLFIYPTEKQKELYVFNAKLIANFLSSRKAKWKSVLSKSGDLVSKLEKYLIEHKIEANSLFDIYRFNAIKIFDLGEIFEKN